MSGKANWRGSRSTSIHVPSCADWYWSPRHVQADSIRVCVFHGPGRANQANDITDYDIVLTTYSVLVADSRSNGRKVLQEVNWYRVVLDEG
jgi:hypothetical protein